MFKTRTITTLVGLPIVIALIWFDRPIPWFTLLAVVWGAGAAYEFYHIVSASKGISPLVYFGLAWVTLFIISPHFDYPPALALLLVTAVIFPLVVSLGRRGKDMAFSNWAWTIAGILYIGWLLSYMVALRNLPDGRGWVFLAVMCTFASDISAYLVGRTFGKHKLAPYVSPNKTWEGSIGGVLGAVAVGVLVIYLFPLLAGGFPEGYVRPVGYGTAVILGALISAAGQLGDLVKSLFKRNTGVKDSGRAIPGHGGFLDRMDSLAFAGVAVYYYVFYLT